MPLSSYFKGKGPQVMSDMIRRYGAQKGKSVFYATANSKGQAPKVRRKRRKVKRA
jgi:hypothetical protein